MRTEYLIIVKQENTFCNSKEAFLSFLKVDSSIQISRNIIQYSEAKSSHTIKAKFLVETGLIPSQLERYFHLILESTQNENEQAFVNLCATVKEIALRINPKATRVNTLWDEIGQNYAIKAYPLINEIENLMRKLISKFMLINVGMSWSQESIDHEILEKIENRHGEQDSYLDILQKTDFIHLSEVLFKKYRTLKLNELDRILLNGDLTLETFDQIKKILPRSNWERHFSKIIDYDEDQLKKKWKLLYDLRNDVAHNRYINESDFKKIRGLANEIRDVLVETINKLDKIDLTDDDKENIISSYDPNSPNSLQAQNFIAESAVTEWYINNYEPIQLKLASSPMDHFDLFIESEDNKIAVEIKHVFSGSLSKMLNLLRNRHIGRANKMLSENQITEFHIVIVIRDFMDVTSKEKLLWYIADFQRTLNSNIKFFVGYLDDESKFVAFIFDSS